jgi:Na+-translocating ferredoxin:NAD+ oxidoreductase RnfC subunit
MSLGNTVENLPGTEESGMKLAEQHRGTLQGASWRAIQEKVTPQLAAYFHDHEHEWAAELERISFHREINHFFKEVTDAGQSATSMKDLPFDDFRKQFLPIAKEHSQAIVNLVVSGVECGPETPVDVVLFAQRAKDVLEAIPIPELRTEVTQGFLRPFVEKE